ncbi:MAG: symmetrical bis(5'-nucleosyl)-tetraphosphatase [Pseudomonadota bacterium]
MTTYAIGDVQGCFEELGELLERVNFDATTDRLWFAGDLVNRGPNSLAVLRFVKDLGERASVVLGNHDLHLLGAARGLRKLRPDDTLQPILNAPDCGELLDWLRHQPVLHFDPVFDAAMVHAGIPPQWTIEEALARAREVEVRLGQGAPGEMLDGMYGNKPTRWHDELEGWSRLRYIINAFTRMRFCTADGKLNLKFAGTPEDAPDDLHPWFALPQRASAGTPIVFGHWATLELAPHEAANRNAYHIDNGCVWGNALTAVEVGTWQYTSVGSRQPKVHGE